MKALSITVTCLAAVWIGGCASLSQESKLNTFLDKHETKVMPLQKEAALAYWRAATSGKAEDYDKKTGA